MTPGDALERRPGPGDTSGGPPVLWRRSTDVTRRGRRLEGLVIPWDTPATVTDDGRTTYREAWAPGSVTPAPGRVPVYDSHDPVTGARGALVGVLEDVEDTPAGLAGTVVLAQLGRAAEVAELATLVDVGLSAEVDAFDTPPPADGVVRRSRGTLTGLALILPPHRPAYADARVTALRQGEPPMPTMTDLPPDPDTPPEDPPEPDPEDARAVMRQNVVPLDRVRELVAEEVTRSALRHPSSTPPAGGPLTAFRSFAEYTRAAFDDPTLFRALADQVTTDNPGVIPPGWVKEVFGILDHSSPLVAHLRRPAPASGMDVSWPFFDGDLYALVAAQATEKTAITSVKVSLKKGTEPLATYAGGSDLSYQLIRRSDPSYLDAYMRIMAAAYAAVTGRVFATDLLAGSAMHVLLDPATATVDAAAAAIFEASTDVARATGTPASIIAAGDAMFVALGKAALTVQAGVAPGSASAAALSVNYAGLSVVFDPALPVGTAVATNRTAAAWFEDGPFTVNAEDVEKLGRNVAVWGMGATGVTAPNGVVEISATAGATTSRSGRSSKE